MKSKTQQILRENVKTVLHAVTPLPTPKWNPEAPSRFAAKRQEGAAAPRTNSWTTNTVYDGEELKPFTGRTGSMKAYAIPSKGSSG